ncbi:ribosome silencing factor [Halobacteriovorax sp. HFRX-2_2]|uniref:ribosome silencing factor n=2 Tax=Halobacteriovorax TaxID=1652133 RepID=UPI00371528BC
MSQNEFITKNVDEITDNSKLEFPLNIAMASAWILGNFKGINLKVLDMRKTTALADYFILASATNSSMANAMSDEIAKQMKRKGQTVISKEGLHQQTDWILIDLGDIIVHIFDESAREAYDIDNLWSVPTVEIPNEYYYSSDEAESSADSDKGYF